ncbi:receptor-like protein kinase 7 [Diospyros lotus]|uniref:receptor-like protein kinase 7 n=1 Tax=Diospyros lotus TaxID=55363 RepID=UPI002251A3B7|nr:receptor-like protein kinase 7 [Diospyros lotus]
MPNVIRALNCRFQVSSKLQQPPAMSAELVSRRQPGGGIFLAFLCLLSLVAPPSRADEQLEALLGFKTALAGSNTSVFDSWTDQNYVCDFTGISCDGSQMVREINLPRQRLSGTLAFEAICSLGSLEKISLGSNSLNGRIGEELANCTRLKYLDLGMNSFAGEVPDLSSLVELKFLNLNQSGFSGKFPWKSLENLTRLEFLSLGDNPFDKNSFPLEVLNMKKLYWLYLSNCSLEGQIPEGIGNLTLLQNLELSDNLFFGKIPRGITKLKQLWQLELYDNDFAGEIPVGFRNLTNLVKFDASANNLEGDLSELKYLTQLESLQLFENRFSGEIPAEFGYFKSLLGLSLYTNRLTGSLPPKIGSWADFNFIDVTGNFLTGPIPADMCKNGKMIDLLLLQNKFTGGIPASYAHCSTLERLRVNNNSLSGVVPAEIWSLPNLSIIDLTGNQFEGPVAATIGGAESLAQLFLAYNRFSGELPASLSNTTSLVAIDMSYNQFSGEIPASIGNLKRLSSIHLESNLFSGTIPESLGSCSSLSELNLACNSFSGVIPASIGSVLSLNSLNLSDNKLSGQIPASLSSLRFSLLDLSNNRLVGPIPESLSIEAYSKSFAGNPGLCNGKLRNFRSCSSDSNDSSSIRTKVSCFVAGATVLFVSLACFMYVKYKTKGRDQNRPIKSDGSWNMKQFHVLSFTEEEVMDGIRTENLIGKGGSGNVYRVVLRCGKQLAVKHIWKPESDDRRICRSSAAILAKGGRRWPEFDAEVATLSSVRHVNVVKLYCSITSEDSNLLVYEYLPNGSLWDRMHTGRKMEMDWDVRYEIAVGAARGLEYLHHGCNRPVIHRDVKSSNILLDEEMKPKIADFGLARVAPANDIMDSTLVIAGTLGYIAPEYAYTCKVNEKSDVYSFGVVLMELVTGKRPVEAEFGEDRDIVQWVCGQMRSHNGVLHLVDAAISEDLKESAATVLSIALHCTMKTPALRPSMRAVVQMLEEAKPLELREVVVNKG